MYLCPTPSKGDGSALSKEVPQHTGDIVGDTADVHNGEVAEEEIHGTVESVVRADKHKDEYVFHQSGRIEYREKAKEAESQGWVAGEPQQDEFCDRCFILHAVLEARQHKVQP